MSRVSERWSWRGRCECGASGAAQSSDRALVEMVAKTWLDTHRCEPPTRRHAITIEANHEDDCAIAQRGFAGCTCGAQP